MANFLDKYNIWDTVILRKKKLNQNLTDTEVWMVVTRGKGAAGSQRIKGFKYIVTEEDLTLVVGTQCNIQRMYHRIVHLKHIILLNNFTPINN